MEISTREGAFCQVLAEFMNFYGQVINPLKTVGWSGCIHLFHYETLITAVLINAATVDHNDHLSLYPGPSFLLIF